MSMGEDIDDIWQPALLMAPALALLPALRSRVRQPALAGAAMSGRFSEAPMLAARVAAGELPPVQERIPVDPVVQEMRRRQTAGTAARCGCRRRSGSSSAAAS